MEHVVHADQGLSDSTVLSHVTDVELDIVATECDAHILLLLLVAAEDADLRQIGVDEVSEHRVPEGPGAASDEECFACEHDLGRSEQIS